MCGFAGVVDFERAVDAGCVRTMARLLRHRGPDSEGFVEDEGMAMAGLRLAIIGADERGRQPFESGDGRHALCFNGAVYNYRELRAELRSLGRSFRSETDTEVVLEAFRAWGRESLARMNGMFAFAIWDRAERRLFAARDRFGVKPLYYTRVDGRFAFASEIKSLLTLDAVTPSENPARLADFLLDGRRDHTTDTLFAGVRQLAPASWLELERGGLRSGVWWTPPLEGPEQPRSAEEIRDLVEDAVRIRLRSDVPIGTCLSGGLDSASVVALASGLIARGDEAGALGPRQRAFTVGFPGQPFDEEAHARTAAEAAGAELHVCHPAAGGLLELLPRVTWHHDEPLPGASVIAQWHVMETARGGGVTVLLDGQGADELFAGYEGTVGSRLADIIASGHALAALREARAFGHGRDRSAAWLGAVTARAFVPERRQREALARIGAASRWLSPELRLEETALAVPGRDRLRRRLGEVIRAELPSLLHNEDRNSMAFSLEARVPFLDVRIAEAALALPATDLIANGETKVALRRAVEGLVPASIVARRRKIGFVAPEQAWIAAERDGVAELLGTRFASRGWVRPEAVRDGCARLLAGERQPQIWRWLAAESWARQFLDGDRPPLDSFAR